MAAIRPLCYLEKLRQSDSVPVTVQVAGTESGLIGSSYGRELFFRRQEVSGSDTRWWRPLAMT